MMRAKSSGKVVSRETIIPLLVLSFLLGLPPAIGGAWTSSATAATDATAPAAVADLHASAPAKAPQLHIVLSWTAPGDDGAAGTATGYDIRYRTDGPLSETNWATAQTISGEPIPGAAGSSETMSVVGLKPNTTYYWAIKTSDEVPNTSGISNSPNLTTAKYEGYGSGAVGGGEKPIFHVTNLNDSGAGSLRDALSQGNRYIVFDVGGTILLQSLLDTRTSGSSFITVDGSTAPSPGITIGQDPALSPGGLNDGWRIGDQNQVILTYLRIRGSFNFDFNPTPNAQDTLTTNNTSASGVTSNLVWDHLTVRNSGDAAADLYDRVQDASISYCYFLHNQHPMTTGGDAPSARITWHHNVFAENGERNPQLINRHTDLEYVNNVLYHWGFDPNPGAGYTAGTYGIRIRNNTPGPGDVDANIVNNYFIAGATHANAALVYGSGPGADAGEESGPSSCLKQGGIYTLSRMGQLWVAGNVFPAQNCDEYSTVSAPRTVPASNRVTADPVSTLRTAVLPSAGTLFRLSDEQSLLDAVGASLGGGGAVCGNNIRESGETCDGLDLGGATCISLGFTSGTLLCNPACSGFDVSQCVNAPPSDVRNLRRGDNT